MWFWIPVPEWLLTGSCCRLLILKSTGTSPVVSQLAWDLCDWLNVCFVYCCLTLSCVLQAHPERRSRSTGIGWSLTCCRPSPSLTTMKTSPPSSKERSLYVSLHVWPTVFFLLVCDPVSEWCHFPAGHHCRGEPTEAGGGAGGGLWEVSGGRAEDEEAVWDAWWGEAGELLLLQLLEGPSATTGLALPVRQPPVLLLLPVGQGGYDQPITGQSYYVIYTVCHLY